MPSAPIDNSLFREVLFRPSVAREFFLPFEHARWEGDTYTLAGANQRLVRPDFAGLRLQAAEPNDPNQVIERQCQNDLRKLVSTVREIRQDKALSGVVISNELVLGRQPDSPCRRVIFGLYRPTDDRFRDDNKAAEECHRQIGRAVAKAGLRVEKPGPFDPKSGMKGLEEWAGSVRLCRNPWPVSPYWLLLLLLIPIFLLLWGCPSSTPITEPNREEPRKQEDPGPWKVDTDSFLILVDKSGSMVPYFPQIREESKRLLNKRITQQKKSFADIIVYDQNAASALGEIMEVNNPVADRLISYIENLKAGGGTNLESAIQLAGERVKKHGKETTLLIVTDGEDDSIPKMLKDPARVRACFGNINVKAVWTTPRSLKDGASQEPQNKEERDLQEFTRVFSK